MTRFVVTPDVVAHLGVGRAAVHADHRLVAPTLLRSQVLSALYGAARRGEITAEEAGARLDHMRALRIRLLGDRVLQRVAWRIATDLGRSDTFDAEYLALTRLQADALVTLDAGLAEEAARLVPVARVEDLFAPGATSP
jgi:predicted nucleic acid-binding protein